MCKQDLSSDCKCLPPVRDAGGGWGIKKKKGGGERERAREREELPLVGKLFSLIVSDDTRGF